MVLGSRWQLVGLVFAAACRINFDDQPLGDAGADGGGSGDLSVCSTHWCWDKAPPPELRTLRAIDGSGTTDVWAVGDGGVIRRWNGVAWATFQSPTGDTLTAVDAVSPTDVTIAAGAGSVWHWDGSLWQASTTPSGSSVAAFWRDELNRLWAAGDNGTISIDGVAAAGQPARRAGLGLHGTSSTNVWHAGRFNTVSRWTGGPSWASTGIADFPRAVWSLAGGDAFVAGANLWRCTPALSCTQEPPGNPEVFDFWAAADTDVWAAGSAGGLYHFNGSTWQQQTAPVVTTFFAIWGNTADDVWAVGIGGAIIHYDGSTWTSVGADAGLPSRWNAIWIGDETDIWLSNDTMWHSDGGPPEMVTLPSGAVLGEEMEGRNANDLYVLDYANGDVLHWDGVSWTTEAGLDLPMPTGLAVATDEVIASNIAGQIFEKTPASGWTMRTDTSAEYHSICVSPIGRAIAVGRFGTSNVRASPGATWLPVTTPTARFLLGCSFVADAEAWAAGGDAILHYVAGGWTLDSGVPTGESMQDVLGISPSEVYIAGTGGRLLAYDGAAWKEEALPFAGSIRKITRSQNGTIYATGDELRILRRR